MDNNFNNVIKMYQEYRLRDHIISKSIYTFASYLT